LLRLWLLAVFLLFRVVVGLGLTFLIVGRAFTDSPIEVLRRLLKLLVGFWRMMFCGRGWLLGRVNVPRFLTVPFLKRKFWIWWMGL